MGSKGRHKLTAVLGVLCVLGCCCCCACAGTTIDMVGLSSVGSDKEGGSLMGYLSKEQLLKDIQFR
jgi:hypothetical protein